MGWLIDFNFTLPQKQIPSLPPRQSSNPISQNHDRVTVRITITVINQPGSQFNSARSTIARFTKLTLLHIRPKAEINIASNISPRLLIDRPYCQASYIFNSVGAGASIACLLHFRFNPLRRSMKARIIDCMAV
jgi:hypothetical protein